MVVVYLPFDLPGVDIRPSGRKTDFRTVSSTSFIPFNNKLLLGFGQNR